MKSSLSIVSLKERIKHGDLLDEMITDFFCSRDLSVESFLKTNAINFERKGFSRTYLYIEHKSDETPKPRIAAYFSVAITSTHFEDVSKTRRKKIIGFDKPGATTKDHFGGLLIGQLGRADSYTSKDINGQEMIEAAEEIIESARSFVGGRIIYIDCGKDLIPLYENNGYELIIDRPFSGAYYKMFKSLPDMK